MKAIVCYVRPHKLEEIKTALVDLGAMGMTVCDARGCGSPRADDPDWVIRMPVRTRLELVVPDDRVEETIEMILRNARTGQADDGKIFVLPIESAIRVRTGEEGEIAVT
ncbi:MAG: P-II family nitrogen regulator [Armatimonadetes bacterium]|nr:P-II family nitrogen regulator [Armatimonadota bacterium]